MSQSQTRLDAVLFDLDGTLVETSIDFALMKQEIAELAAIHGVEQASPAGLDVLAMVEGASEIIAAQGKRDEAAALRERAMEILEEIEMRHASLTQEIPFAREMVARLKAMGIGVGIVTRNCRKASRLSLQITGISPDVLVCREDSLRHKPHPEQLHLALCALNTSAQDSVMVGDHIMDVESGRAAGMRTIGFLRDSRPADFFEQVKPDFTARSLPEVFDAIVRLHS